MAQHTTRNSDTLQALFGSFELQIDVVGKFCSKYTLYSKRSIKLFEEHYGNGSVTHMTVSNSFLDEPAHLRKASSVYVT